MRSMPPTGGATSVIVRPARRSPVAWTDRRSGPLASLMVGTVTPRSGSRETALMMPAPPARTPIARTPPIRRRVIGSSGSISRLPPNQFRRRLAGGDAIAGTDATVHDRELFAAPRHLHLLLDELPADQFVDHRMAVALEQRLRRDQQHVGYEVGRDPRDRAHAGPDFRIDL